MILDITYGSKKTLYKLYVVYKKIFLYIYPRWILTNIKNVIPTNGIIIE